MHESRASDIGVAVMLTCLVAFICLVISSSAGELPRLLPVGEKLPTEAPAQQSEAPKEAPDAMAILQERLKTATEAYETLKRELAPRLAEAHANLQQVSSAQQQAVRPEETQWLEEEVRLAGEWLSLLGHQLVLAEEEVRVAEGLLEIAQRRAALSAEKAQHEDELRAKALTPQDAKLATAEAEVAADRVVVATGRVETLQEELLSLEKEVAEFNLASTRAQQQVDALVERVAAQPSGTEKVALERELARARRQARGLQKKAELAQKQLELTRGKLELAKQDHDFLVAQSEHLAARAQAIRAIVGLSLEDLKAEQEEVSAAQRAAEAEKQKAEAEQAKAQQERQQAQAALAQAKVAREQATTPAQLRLAELNQQLAEKRAELAQKKADLAKEKIEVASKAAEVAQKRLILTTRRLEIERRALTATEILDQYELAKAEASRALKAAQASRANAELARREMEAFKREAELAQLKVQAGKSQAEAHPPDPVMRETVRALEGHARLAEERAQVAEEWANVLQERARLAAEGVQISTDLTQLLGMHRATYQLWKREPSKISWGVVDEFATDLVVLRSALIIGLSTLPGRIVDGLVGLAYPSHYWEVLGNATGMAIVFMLAVVGATWLRHRLHPVITRQEAWSEPSSRQKSLRAITRLLHATVLAVLLFIASLLSLRVATAGRTFLIVVAMAAAGAVAYTLLKGILQELFMPWNPGQRLITCRDSIAGFLYTHLRRISLYAAVGLTLIYILQAVEYREGIVELLRLAFDVGLLVLCTLTAANKEAIVSLLPHAENRLEKSIYVIVTQVYPLLVVVLICIIALSTLGYVNMAKFLAVSCALTAAVLAAAHLACRGIDRLLRWRFLTRRPMASDVLLSAEARGTMYVVLTHALCYLVYIVAIVVIAGIWGVDLSGVYATLTSETAQDYYQRLAAAIIIIVVSSLFLRSTYYLIDKIFNLSAEEARAWRRRIALGDKGRTIAPLLKSLLKYSTIFVAGVLVLRAMGVDPTPIIAGAGVIGLAVGFGAQTLVKDVIAGFFLLFEGVIAVGDVITFGASGGVVEEVGLRVTKYRTFSGELWVIPNGEIRAFGNFNRQWTRAVVPVGVAYEQDVGKAMRILEEVGKQWAEERRDIVLEEPEVQGILAFDDSSISLRLVVKVRPLQHWVAERQLRCRIKEAFDREGIEIPFPRRVIYTHHGANNTEDGDGDRPLQSKRVQKVEKSTA